MVRRTEPLVVNVFMATFAGIGLHKELAWNLLIAVHLRRTWEKGSLGPISLSVHIVGRHVRVLNSIASLPAQPHITCSITNASQHYEADHGSQKTCRWSRSVWPGDIRATLEPICREKAEACHRNRDVEIKLIPLRSGRSGLNQDDSQNRARHDEEP